MSEKTSKKIWAVILKRSIIFFLAAVIAGFGLYFAGKKYSLWLPGQLNKIFVLLAVLITTAWAFKISGVLFAWYGENMTAKTETTLDDKFMPLFKRFAGVLIWSTGLIILLGQLGINISSLVATLGIGSLAIALAAQDTISNIIAGFLIMLDRPFSVGDCIKLPSGEKVKVLDVGIRRSKFLADDKAVVIMPNLELSKSKIINYSYAERPTKNA